MRPVIVAGNTSNSLSPFHANLLVRSLLERESLKLLTLL
jgi:hypothetical protein